MRKMVLMFEKKNIILCIQEGQTSPSSTNVDLCPKHHRKNAKGQGEFRKQQEKNDDLSLRRECNR